MSVSFKERKIKDFFDLTEIYEIPSYQRDYKWGELEIETFIKDIFSFFDKVRNTQDYNLNYFFGTIITQKTKSGSEESSKFDYYLIDGQQRLTTFYIFKKSLIDLAVNKKWVATDINNLYYINFNKSRDITGDFKLQNKNNILKKHIFDSSFTDENLKKNYDLIYRHLENKITTDKLYNDFEYIMQLLIVGEIEIGTEQNAEEVFENINSKGKPLSLSELIKNKLLLINNLIKKEQTSTNRDNENELKQKNNSFEERIINVFDEIESIQNSIEKSDKPIMSSLGFKQKDELIRAVVSTILKINIDLSDGTYKRLIKPKLESLYSESYEAFEQFIYGLEFGLGSFKTINAIISHDTEASFYLKWIFRKSPAFNIVVPQYIKKKLDEKSIGPMDLAEGEKSGKLCEIIEIVKKVYKLIAKTSIFTSGFSGINLWRDIAEKVYLTNDEIDFENTILNVAGLINNETDATDESEGIDSYESKITDIDFYKSDRLLLKSLLILIENKKDNEDDNEVKTWLTLNEMFDDAKWTIEHIIPVTIKKDHKNGIKWMEMLGDVEYQSLINKIGNLTLANQKMNTKMGNKSFDEKVKILLGSKLLINNDICNMETFNVQSLNQRATELKPIIIELLD